MRNKSKQDQSIKMNDYEKVRAKRIQENEEIFRGLGIKNTKKSLTSQKEKKKKVKPTHPNVRDEEYIPMTDDSEGDQQEVATRVEIPKKQHRQQYIAPLAMHMRANLAKKRRVIAPKVSDKFPFDSNAKKGNQSRVTITMGELISSSKRPQKQSEAFTHKPKRRLDLIDEDDEIFEDVNGEHMELHSLKDNEDERDAIRSEDDFDQDDEYEDMDHITTADNEHEIQGDDSEDDVENEADVLAQEQLHQPDLEKSIEISKLKKRGPTMMHRVHMRKATEREVIICNEFGQVVGPVTKAKDTETEFSNFLGTIARNHTYAPLIHKSWHKVPHKDKIWEYVLEKYDVPEAAKTWVLMTIGHAYKVNKCRFKKNHFYKFKDNKTRWRNRPKSIPEDEFHRLLTLWSDKNVAKRCLAAKDHRMSQKNMHTAGPKSFARIRDEMKNKDPNNELPSLTEMFERTRKRTEGHVYVDTYNDTAQKIEQMKSYKPLEDGSASVDPFSVVINQKNGGYCRLYGRGVNKKMLNKVDGGDTSNMIPEGLIESLQTSIEVEKNQLVEMRKKMKDDHERKEAELDAKLKDIQNQRESFEDMVLNFIKKLPIEYQDF